MPVSRPRSLYVGVDPGASGGLVVIGPSGVVAEKMPATEADVWGWVSLLHLDGYLDGPPPEVYAAVEKVGGYVGEAQPGSAAFKFGLSYGGVRMALTAAGVPFDDVTPQTWQKAFGLHRGKAESKTAWKNRLKAKAQQLFPGVAVTLATADALLIAEYCRRKHEGRL